MKNFVFGYVVTGLLLVLFTAGSAAAIDELRTTARADANQDVAFEVYLPLQNSAELDHLLLELQNPNSPSYRKWLTPEEFRGRFAPKAEDVARITDALRAYGLQVTYVHSHGLHVEGKAKMVENAFGVQLWKGVSANGSSRLVAKQALTLPSALSQAGAQIVHFSPNIHMHTHSRSLGAVPENRYSSIGGYWFDDLKQAYEYPSYLAYTGKGVTIGILMSGAYHTSDMNLYFGHEKLATPAISEVDIYGGAPYSGDNLETPLDIQQSGGMAPGANIVLFNIPDLYDDSILAGLTTIIEGNATTPGNFADVVNMSFGGPEIGYLPEYNGGVNEIGILGVYDDLFKQGASQGISFVASSGDLGAYSVPAPACFAPGATTGCGRFKLSVETPASSPNVTGVGGTNLVTLYNPPSLDSTYVEELAFPDALAADIFYGTPATGGHWGSGGGISIYYPKPVYQLQVNSQSKYRTVPDVALHMGGCPYGAVLPCAPDRSYDLVAISGKFYGVIGTSASSPDFAGLTALKVEREGKRLGNENFEIYALSAAQAKGDLASPVYRQDIHGSNVGYQAQPGYNMVLGNGTVFGTQFILAPHIPAAGIPQTPTNP